VCFVDFLRCDFSPHPYCPGFSPTGGVQEVLHLCTSPPRSKFPFLSFSQAKKGFSSFLHPAWLVLSFFFPWELFFGGVTSSVWTIFLPFKNFRCSFSFEVTSFFFIGTFNRPTLSKPLIPPFPIFLKYVLRVALFRRTFVQVPTPSTALPVFCFFRMVSPLSSGT